MNLHFDALPENNAELVEGCKKSVGRAWRGEL